MDKHKCPVPRNRQTLAHTKVPLTTLLLIPFLTQTAVFAKWPSQIVHNTNFSFFGSFMVKRNSISMAWRKLRDYDVLCMPKSFGVW